VQKTGVKHVFWWSLYCTATWLGIFPLPVCFFINRETIFPNGLVQYNNLQAIVRLRMNVNAASEFCMAGKFHLNSTAHPTPSQFGEILSTGVWHLGLIPTGEENPKFWP
jgi:hypothetical protein